MKAPLQKSSGAFFSFEACSVRPAPARRCGATLALATAAMRLHPVYSMQDKGAGVSGGITRWLLRAVENLLIAAFVAMIGLVFGNVVMRYGFDSGIIMSEEVSRMIFVWLTFGGAFLVAREGGHLGMGMVVERLGVSGRWWCRLLSEALSLLAMILVTVGCWRQTVLNLSNLSPITGTPVAVIYMAGLACGVGIAALNVMTLLDLLRGRIPPEKLIVGVESEDMAGHRSSGAGPAP